ncbi:hypothetical protein A7982_12601 [Minicystis rosea]|nr:hypothetical protein A7982_12601 [Minicystis rosea]
MTSGAAIVGAPTNRASVGSAAPVVGAPTNRGSRGERRTSLMLRRISRRPRCVIVGAPTNRAP